MLDTALRVGCGIASVLTLVAGLCRWLGRPRSAIEICERGLKRCPRNAQLQGALQRACLDAGDWSGYWSVYEQAQRLEPADLATKRSYGSALLMFGRYTEAAAQLRSCVENWNLGDEYEGALANTQARLGICYAYLQEWSLAESALKQALAVSPWDPDCIFGEVLVKLGNGHATELLSFLDGMIAINRRSYPIRYWKAFHIQYRAHDPQASIEWYEAALQQINSYRYKRVYRPFSISCVFDAHPNTMLQEYAEALGRSGAQRTALWRVNWHALRCLGAGVDYPSIRISWELGSAAYKSAEKHCLIELRHSRSASRKVLYWGLLAEALGGQADIVGGIAAAEHGLAIQADNWRCLKALSNLQMRVPNWAAAALGLERALKLEPFDAESWRQLAACYGQLGRSEIVPTILARAARLEAQ